MLERIAAKDLGGRNVPARGVTFPHPGPSEDGHVFVSSGARETTRTIL